MVKELKISNEYSDFIDLINAIRKSKYFPISIQKSANTSYSNIPEALTTAEWCALIYGDETRLSIILTQYTDTNSYIGCWFNGWTIIVWNRITQTNCYSLSGTTLTITV